MSEQKLQTKILQWLKDNGFYALKVVTANRAGVLDIVGCTPTGRLFAIEVKWGANKASPLQVYNIDEINRRGGIAFLAYDLSTVINHLGEFSVDSLPPLSGAYL